MAYAQNGPYNTKLTLFPSLTLPNKLAYLMNPQETQEIQCQVDDLLAKGLIRESLGPCAVSTLLMPKKEGEYEDVCR